LNDQRASGIDERDPRLWCCELIGERDDSPTPLGTRATHHVRRVALRQIHQHQRQTADHHLDADFSTILPSRHECFPSLLLLLLRIFCQPKYAALTKPMIKVIMSLSRVDVGYNMSNAHVTALTFSGR
jgi:hypothetical protein